MVVCQHIGNTSKPLVLNGRLLSKIPPSTEDVEAIPRYWQAACQSTAALLSVQGGSRCTLPISETRTPHSARLLAS